MAKLFFEHPEAELCYPLPYFFDDARRCGETIITVYEAISNRSSTEKWCAEYHDIVEPNYCGKQCADYSPCNGKSGKCRHSRSTFYEAGKRLTFYIEEKK